MSSVFVALLLMMLGTFLASGYYVPINKIRNWSWETYWIAQGFVSWIILPWLFTVIAMPGAEIFPTLFSAPGKAVFLMILFGALWGVGGLTWGLGMRYLGVSLGQSIAFGFTAAFGTLIPRFVAGENLFSSPKGIILLVATAITLAGIAVIGYAGSLRSRGLSDEEKRKAVKDFAFRKGLLITVVAGAMSACMNFGLEAGIPLQRAAEAAGATPLLSVNIVHIYVMFGGFLTNLVYCIYLFARNKSFREFGQVRGGVRWSNLLFSFIGGSMWYMQFLFLGMGKSLLPQDSVLLAMSWSILMAFNVVFSNVWGLFLKEWKGSSRKTLTVLAVGLAILIFSVFFPSLF